MIESGDDGTPQIVEYVLYCSCVVGAVLYLPVVLAVLLNRLDHTK